MHKLFLITILFVPIYLFGQKETSYYDNGNVKSEWKTDTTTEFTTNYFFFETGELKSKGIFNKDGVLEDYFHFNQNGDTVARSHIPEFNAQPSVCSQIE